jgi:hypothetical protein
LRLVQFRRQHRRRDVSRRGRGLGTPPADSGLGWQLADKDHGIPASGPFVPPIDFKAA